MWQKAEEHTSLPQKMMVERLGNDHPPMAMSHEEELGLSEVVEEG
jgi:hypothetical protein